MKKLNKYKFFFKNKHYFCLIIFLCFSQITIAVEKKTIQSLSPQDSLLPMIGGLIGILLIIFLLALLIKKFTHLNFSSNHIEVVEAQHIGAKEKLMIVNIKNKQYVLGVTPHTINQICELDEPIEKVNANVSFDSLIKQLLPSSMAKKN